jgi:beta-glucosidase
MASWYRLGQDSPDYPAVGVGMPVDLSAPHKIVDARDPASKQVVFDGGVEGHVLVKNTGSLPLKSPKLLSLFGYDAKSPDTYNIGSPSDILPPWTQGFSSANISSVLLDLISIPNNETFSQIAAKGTVISGGGSGAITPSYVSSPFEAFSIKSQNENTALFWDFTSGNPAVNGDSEACLVFINAFSTEGTDRSGLHDDFSDGLVKNVAEKCNNTIVIIHNAGVRLVDQVRILSNLFPQNTVSHGQ